MTDPVLTAGQAFGPFRVLGHLGRGGMADIFLVEPLDPAAPDPRLVLKVMLPERARDPALLDRFITEADLYLLVEHPKVVQVYQVGEVDGRYWIALEYVWGPDLAALIERARRKGIAIPLDLALYIVSEVLEGLGSAHEAVSLTGDPLHLIHRDVTPANVFVGYGGQIKLGDFGVAYLEGYEEEATDQVLGKLGYLSPEQLRAEPASQSSDLFAVAIICWELLAGQRLFAGGSRDQIFKRIHDADVPRFAKVGVRLARPLEKVVLRALHRKPKKRYASAADLAEALRAFWDTRVGNRLAVAAMVRALFADEIAADPPPLSVLQ